MKVLVTGANGYLGIGVVKSILDLGHQVIATDLSLDAVDARAKKIVGDIFAVDDPYAYFEKPDILLHLAWRNGFIHYSETHIDDLPKHKSFLEKMAQAGISEISVMGTMHEVGFYEGCVDENTPCNPLNYYGIAKNALREIAKIICQKNNVVFKWLRAYYIVGDSVKGSSIFSKIAQVAADGATTFPFTSGKNQYDFLDYREFCRLTALAAVQNEETGIINICSGKPESLGNRVERFIQDNHYSIRLQYGVYPDRQYDSKAIWGNNEKVVRIVNRSSS